MYYISKMHITLIKKNVHIVNSYKLLLLCAQKYKSAKRYIH